MKLYYHQPATRWTEALPVGNGRLGAMIYGGVDREELQLNEDTVWAGKYIDRANPAALPALPEVRRLLFAGRNTEATELATQSMLGIPVNIESYQPLASLIITRPAALLTGYRRELDLRTGIARTTFGNATQEVFASAPDQVIVVRLTGQTAVQLHFEREQESHPLVLTGRLGADGLFYRAEAIVLPVSASEMVILIAGATSYVSPTDYSADPAARCRAVLDRAAGKTYAQLLATHIADHTALFDRVSLDLGSLPQIPTDQLLATGTANPAFAALYFQYGRYLLMASSRPGSQPANLQGIWNNLIKAPWNSDYHPNINIQMNYWPAEVANLSECHQPLFDWMTACVPSGEHMARAHYGARGWVMHHVSDIFACTAPMDGIWGVWPVGGAWLAQHCWEHYAFTNDLAWLRRQGWPLLKGAARFILDFLVESPAGQLVTNPSHSPENEFIKPDGTKSKFTYGATMDLQIAHDLLSNCLAAIVVLADPAEEPFRDELQSALDRLAPLQISPRTGRMQEWIEDYAEPEPGHRHISHLFGLHPGRQLTWSKTPELMAAAQKSLEARLAAGGGHTGWSRAWIVNFWARFGDGERAGEHLRLLFAKSTLPNLFDTHPPFQIDGNFGGCAGIAEMLLQSHEGFLHLLPALPAAWPTGTVRGLRARGGYTVSIAWTAGQLTQATVRSDSARECSVKYRGKIRHWELTPGTETSIFS
ncbi:MAG: hypothetical protein PCFJNLEI_03176 [Verrucomicrobiae bacterium]|nr:hypothetical protein [Verrucomicrobiae bacterium]